ncbi:MAG TPA: glycosyltransferase family 2 protein [Thermoanaerobaculia bacterium]|nr:glycosyltransferase family 2 protein [Thermoanaerobaculia bacterium]
MKTTLIIPALDEEAGLERVLAEIEASPIASRLIDQIIVGDNGSRDSTASVAARHGARVATATTRGYGAACAAALTLLADDCEIVVFMDADASDNPSELSRLVEPIVRGDADLVIGSRTLGVAESGALSPQQRVGNRLAVFLIRQLFGWAYTDLGPFRAIRRSLLDRIDMQDRAYGWTVEMQVRALQLGGRVEERAVSYRKRVGRSKISGTVTGVIKAGWCILATIGRCRVRGATEPSRPSSASPAPSVISSR